MMPGPRVRKKVSPALQSKQRAHRAPAPHHRTLGGREQRARTRANIIAVAIHVFAEQGPHRPQIEDFVKAAGVSRGTFYNYFATVHDLLEAAVSTVTNDYIAAIEPAVAGIENPVIRFACAARLFQQRAHADPIFAAFVGSVSAVSSRIDGELRNDIEAAVRLGLIKVHSVDAALIAAAGMGQYAVQYLDLRRHHLSVPDVEIVRMVLMAWGVAKPLIATALATPLPYIDCQPLSLTLGARRT